MNVKLAREINKMAREDQKMRKTFFRTGRWNSRIDRRNTKRIKEIIKKYGWPTIQLISKKASQNVWLLVQHADHDVKFQKRCLKLMKEAYKKDKSSINLANIAYLTDRVLVHQGKKQIFGTQFYFDKRKIPIPRPIKDIKNLEIRREKYHLGPFKKYLAIVKNPK